MLTVAGRTDSGVHARGQVAHVDLAAQVWQRAEVVVGRRLRSALPPDVRVLRAAPALAGFDARFSALWRRYAYRVADADVGVDPLRRREVLAYHHALDVDRLAAASRPLEGLHDFATFCRRRPGATTLRHLQVLQWERDPAGLVVATVQADAFCHSMVRSLVGALLPVGAGRRPVEWAQQLLAGGRRVPAVNVVPARGLTLEAVGYPADDELALRAEATRATRERSR